MKLPWKGDEEELRGKIEELEEEKQELEQRYEAESRRRSELARKKQEAEEELNRLRDRLRSQEESDEKEEEVRQEFHQVSFDRGYRILRKLASLESPERDMVTVYSPGKVSKIDDFQGLKNAVSSHKMEFLAGKETFIGFLDEDFFSAALRTRPFFQPGWSLATSFDLEKVLDFLESEKTWALVSAGETRIYREEAGETEQVERITSRVDSKQSKGGFSQGRFERKREEQLDEHLEDVEEELENRENVYLLGERGVCKDLPGEHLGGFDPNRKLRDSLYNFSVTQKRRDEDGNLGTGD